MNVDCRKDVNGEPFIEIDNLGNVSDFVNEKNHQCSDDNINVCSDICQSCVEQGNTKPATHWCMTCPDLICEQCYALHMALRSTRSHTILEIDEYRKVGTILTRFDTKCKTHQGEVLNYFCFTHETPCCCICRDKNHTTCNIQHEDEISFPEENCQVNASNCIDIVNFRLHEIEEKLRNNKEISSTLNSQREAFEAELVAGRKEVNEFYDKFEMVSRKKFDNLVSQQQTSLSLEMQLARREYKDVTNKKETIEILKSLNISKLQSFLIAKCFQKDLNEKSLISCQKAEFDQLSIIPIVKVDPAKPALTFTNGFELLNNQDENNKMSENVEENGSSTVEDEVNIALETQETKDNFSSFSIPSECETEEEEVTSSDYDDENNSIEEDEVSYQLINSFFVERRNKGINIVAIGFLEPDLLVMSEASNDRVLFYRTNGFKEGEVTFEEKPGELAVISDHEEVAVGVFKMLFFIDSTDQRIKHRRFLNDYIKGVAYKNHFVFACLQHRGIVELDLMGNIMQTISFIKGSLHICVTTDAILYFVPMGHCTNELYSFNLVTHESESYLMNSLSVYNGIACDIHGNVYLGKANSEMFMFDMETSSFFIISLNDQSNNNVSNMSGLSCSSDSTKLAVVCEKGRKIKYYRKD